MINTIYTCEYVKYMGIHGNGVGSHMDHTSGCVATSKIRGTRDNMRGNTWKHLGIHGDNTNIRKHVRGNTRAHAEWPGKAVEMHATARDPKWAQVDASWVRGSGLVYWARDQG